MHPAIYPPQKKAGRRKTSLLPLADQPARGSLLVGGPEQVGSELRRGEGAGSWADLGDRKGKWRGPGCTPQGRG